MADITTELEVLDEIVDVLGGQSGQHKTVVPVLEDIRDLLAGGGGGGTIPDGSVTFPKLSQDVQEAIDEGVSGSKLAATAEALLGADETAQWATRESTGTGSAIVRSVQGAAVAWNQLAPSDTYNRTGSFPMTAGAAIIAGHKLLMRATFDLAIPEGAGNTGIYVFTYGDAAAQQVNVTSVGSASGTLYSAITTVATSGTSDGTTANVAGNAWIYTSFANGVSGTISGVQLFDLTQMFGSGNEPSTVAEFEAMYPEPYYPYSAPTLKPVQIAGIRSTDAQGGELDSVEWTTQTLRAAGTIRDELTSDELITRVGERAYQSGDESDPTVRTDGTTTYYPLATPTTTPISPALPMTYKVQQGGSESIIVPDGEVSAAPVLTVAEGESAAELVMDALACIATPDGPVATANHTVGTYLTMQGKLYKVTSAIAVGETITAGTNVSETTVMAELIARTA